MVVTDPISDLISRINNAIKRKKNDIVIPSSKILMEIARLLMEEGYITRYEKTEDSKQGMLKIYLKYTSGGDSAIRGFKRISKLSCRIYVGVSDLPKVLDGLGRAMVSTSRGLLTDKECRKNRLGGEVLLHVW